MSSRLRICFVSSALAALLVSPLVPTGSAEGAVVIHQIPGCTFEPGDVPGVNVFFPANCRQVITSSGRVTIVAKGTLPGGFSLQRTFVGPIPCFGHTGRIVATKSGIVRAVCHWRE